MAVTPGAGAAWPPGGEPEEAPRDELCPEVEASPGPVTPGGRAPKSFSDKEVADFLKDHKVDKTTSDCSDKEVADFLTMVDQVLKDHEVDKTTNDCSDKEVADFLMQVNEDIKDRKDEDFKDRKDKDETTSGCSDQDVGDFLTLLDGVLKDYKDKDKAATGTTNGHRCVTPTGCGTAPAEAEPKPKGKRVKMRSFKAAQQEAREKNRASLINRATRPTHPPPERAASKQAARTHTPRRKSPHVSYTVVPSKEFMNDKLARGVWLSEAEGYSDSSDDTSEEDDASYVPPTERWPHASIDIGATRMSTTTGSRRQRWLRSRCPRPRRAGARPPQGAPRDAASGNQLPISRSAPRAAASGSQLPISRSAPRAAAIGNQLPVSR